MDVVYLHGFMVHGSTILVIYWTNAHNPGVTFYTTCTFLGKSANGAPLSVTPCKKEGHNLVPIILSVEVQKKLWKNIYCTEYELSSLSVVYFRKLPTLLIMGIFWSSAGRPHTILILAQMQPLTALLQFFGKCKSLFQVPQERSPRVSVPFILPVRMLLFHCSDCHFCSGFLNGKW